MQTHYEIASKLYYHDNALLQNGSSHDIFGIVC